MQITHIIPWTQILAALGFTALVMLAVAVLIVVETRR